MKKILLILILFLMNITLFGSSKSIMETFHLNGMIFDYGQNIISIEIETNKLKNIL